MNPDRKKDIRRELWNIEYYMNKWGRSEARDPLARLEKDWATLMRVFSGVNGRVAFQFKYAEDKELLMRLARIKYVSALRKANDEYKAYLESLELEDVSQMGYVMKRVSELLDEELCEVLKGMLKGDVALASGGGLYAIRGIYFTREQAENVVRAITKRDDVWVTVVG